MPAGAFYGANRPHAGGITSTADLKFLHWVAAGSSRNSNSKKQHQKSHPESLPPRRGHRVKAGSQPADYGRARDAKLAAPGTKTDENRCAKRRVDPAMSALRQRPICGLRGWDSPIPSSLPRTGSPGANLIGSRWRRGCRGSAGLAPETAVVTKTRLHACSGKVGPGFPIRACAKSRDVWSASPMRSGEQEQ